MSERRTIAVLGGGSAGFTAARTAARAGARVLLFMGARADEASLCVNRGCMPSKALFTPIDVMHHARRQRWLRVEPRCPADYLARIVAWKDREIARFRAYRQRAIRERSADDFRVVRADARFLDPHTVQAAGERFSFDAAVLATGSVPVWPPIGDLEALREEIWTSADILGNAELPGSLVVIGAGAIGLEFSLRYARLGCAVTLLARGRPLSGYPAEFGERLTRIYEADGVRVLPGTAARAVRRDPEGWLVVEAETEDGHEPIVGERVLLATGRRPALEGLGLENVGVVADGDSLEVGPDMRVAGTDDLFAAGDVIGARMVVHQAHVEAGIAADNAVDDGSREWNKLADLQVIYSDPEFAWAGTTPERAAAAGVEVVTGSKESRLVGKLHLAGDDMGLGRFVADARSHELIGAGLLCEAASDLIHLPGYAIDHRHTVHQAAAAEYYHPTRIEIVSSILDDLCARLGGHPWERADEETG